MAVLKRAFRYATKPSGMIILFGGILISTFFPKIPGYFAGILGKNGFYNSLSNAWGDLASRIDIILNEMEETS